MSTRSGASHTLRIEPGRALLYDRRTHQYHPRSAAETFLLVASREVPLQKAVSLLTQNVGEVEAQVALSSLRRLELVGRTRGFQGRVVELSKLNGAWGAPLVAHLGVTLACNFACSHCYSSSGKRAPDELTLQEIFRLIHELSELGVQKLVLGGGEPFIRDELPQIIQEADAFGIDCFVHTNASLLTEERLKALVPSPPAGLAVSLDGPDSETNDAIRGRGTFARALKGMAALRAHYPPGFNLSVTITPKNVESAAEMVDLAAREGAGVLLLRPTYPAGEALADSELACDRETFIRAVEAARVRAQELGVTVDAPHPDEEGEPGFEGFGCVAARVVLGISPRGDVTPCLNLPDSFIAGNVRQKSLSALWKSGKAFLLIRAQKPNAQCGECRHYETCRGGCRVRALFAGNGLNGPDSWCHFEPKSNAVTGADA